MSQPAAAYTTPLRLRLWLSGFGVDVRSADPVAEGADRLQVAQECCLEATYELFQHYGLRYRDGDLAASLWVRQQATVLAAERLCARLNNLPLADQIRKDAERVREEARRVQEGKVEIAGIGLRKAAVPTLSKVRIFNWPHPHPVVERRSSTGTPEGYQPHYDPTEWYDPAWGSGQGVV